MLLYWVQLSRLRACARFFWIVRSAADGLYEVPDLASVPITPAGDKAEWTTEVAVPQDVTGLYILLSAETGKQRLYANYAVDITDK